MRKILLKLAICVAGAVVGQQPIWGMPNYTLQFTQDEKIQNIYQELCKVAAVYKTAFKECTENYEKFLYTYVSECKNALLQRAYVDVDINSMAPLNYKALKLIKEQEIMPPLERLVTLHLIAKKHTSSRKACQAPYDKLIILLEQIDTACREKNLRVETVFDLLNVRFLKLQLEAMVEQDNDMTTIKNVIMLKRDLLTKKVKT